MTMALEGGEGSLSRLNRSLPPGKTRYPLYMRLGGPQGWSGQVQKISSPLGFDPRTVQPVASRCTDQATCPIECQDLGWMEKIQLLFLYVFAAFAVWWCTGSQDWSIFHCAAQSGPTYWELTCMSTPLQFTVLTEVYMVFIFTFFFEQGHYGCG